MRLGGPFHTAEIGDVSGKSGEVRGSEGRSSASPGPSRVRVRFRTRRAAGPGGAGTARAHEVDARGSEQTYPDERVCSSETEKDRDASDHKDQPNGALHTLLTHSVLPERLDRYWRRPGAGLASDVYLAPNTFGYR
jgi:hypothetical protein